MAGTGTTSAPPEHEELAARTGRHSIPTAPEETALVQSLRARFLRRVGMTVLAVFLLVGATGVLGVRTATVTAQGGGYDLTVTYGAVTRPGLATPFAFEVRRAGGFDGPVTVSASADYFELWDENSLDPEPSASTSTADAVIWEFEPPPGDVLAVSFDGRIEPGRQWGKAGRTSVLVDGQPVATARYRTTVLP